MATHSSVLAWRIPGMGEPGGLPSMGSHRVGHDWSNLAAAAAAAAYSIVIICCCWELQDASPWSRSWAFWFSLYPWQLTKCMLAKPLQLWPTLCLQCGRPGFDPWVRILLPGKSHRWRRLVGYSLLGHKEKDMTEWLHFHFLWDPRDYSTPGSSVHGILQARKLEWVALPFSGDLPNPGVEPVSPVAPALQADSLPLSHQGMPSYMPAWVLNKHTLWCWYSFLKCFPEQVVHP